MILKWHRHQFYLFLYSFCTNTVRGKHKESTLSDEKGTSHFLLSSWIESAKCEAGSRSCSVYSPMYLTWYCVLYYEYQPTAGLVFTIREIEMFSYNCCWLVHRRYSRNVTMDTVATTKILSINLCNFSSDLAYHGTYKSKIKMIFQLNRLVNI